MKNKFTKTEISWILYDVGNSAFVLMLSTVIPIIFKSLTTADGISDATSTAYWAYTLSAATLINAFLAPTLGRLADKDGRKKKLFLGFLLTGCLGVSILGFATQWMAFLGIFLIARIGYSGSVVFYDSMLTDVTTDERSDRVSSNGFAWGYIGSCVPFAISMIFILMYESIGISFQLASIIAFLIVAVWWFLCSTPLLRNYKQIHYVENNEKDSFITVIKGLGGTLKKIKNNKPVMMFLIAFFFYIDGVYTIIEMATVYGTDVGISSDQLLLALLVTQIVAFPCAIIFGMLARKINTRVMITVAILAYIAVAIFALQLDKAWEFWLLAVVVGMFQGGIQALSRSYFSRLVPKENSNEFFGFYDIFGKGAAFTGTLLVGLATDLTQNSTYGVAVIGLLLVVGLIFFLKIPKNHADI